MGVWGIYEILSAFTLTRISGMSFKKLGLFRGQMYTLAVFTATMLSAAQAFGHFGPFALFLFLCIYSAVHKQPQPKRKRVKKNKQSQSQSQSKPQTVNWAEEAQRNPFRGEESMVLVRSLLKEGDHLNQTATKEDRARIVFQVITGKMDAEWLSQDHLVKVLCPSGVSLSSIKTSFDELSTVNPMTNEKGIHLRPFSRNCPLFGTGTLIICTIPFMPRKSRFNEKDSMNLWHNPFYQFLRENEPSSTMPMRLISLIVYLWQFRVFTFSKSDYVCYVIWSEYLLIPRITFV